MPRVREGINNNWQWLDLERHPQESRLSMKFLSSGGWTLGMFQPRSRHPAATLAALLEEYDSYHSAGPRLRGAALVNGRTRTITHLSAQKVCQGKWRSKSVGVYVLLAQETRFPGAVCWQFPEAFACSAVLRRAARGSRGRGSHYTATATLRPISWQIPAIQSRNSVTSLALWAETVAANR